MPIADGFIQTLREIGCVQMRALSRFGTLLGAVVVTAAALTLGAGTASAAGDTPLYGELCTARENIQFYNDLGQPSYVVEAGGGIRIDSNRDTFFVYGHGNGHSTRLFQWRHSYYPYPSRVSNCH